MALKDKWVDKVDGVDIASADDINQVASAVIELENQVESGGGKGEDGFSPVVSVEKIEGGNRVVITDAKGDNTFDVMDGADGKDGQDGVDGKDGTSVTVESVNESTEDGGSNVVKFSDGKTVTIKNGSKGSTGATGAAGADGKDYVLTEADKKEIAEMVGVNSAPDYIVAEAERVSKAVQDVRTARTLVFSAMSDMHLYAGNAAHNASLVSAQYAGMGVDEMQKRMHIDFTAYLGDYSWMDSNLNYTVEQVKADIAAFKETTGDADEEVWCVGNHDLNYGKNRDRLLTLDELYGYIGANSDGVKPYNNIERCYGYIDFDNQKIRVIYLNTCDTSDWAVTAGENARSEWISPTQMQWLADTALDFNDKDAPSEWGIVIVGHHPLHYPYKCYGKTMEILEGYRDGTAGSVENVIDGVTHKVYFDFTNATERAEIICNIHGHNHNCGASKISSTSWAPSLAQSTPWLWRLCIPNLCVGRENSGYTNFASNEAAAQNFGEFDDSGNPVYWTKETGTAKATSFCVVSIDRTNKKIYAHIFGAGKDRVVSYGDEEIVMLSVTNSLTNCTTSNSNTEVEEGTSYVATITARDGYTMDGATVTVTMGGVDITYEAYGNGVVSIGSVTGDVVITASAAVEIINWLPRATSTLGGTDIYGADYDGDGAKDGYLKNSRYSNSQGIVEGTATGYYLTGIIPVSGNDIIRIKDTAFGSSTFVVGVREDGSYNAAQPASYHAEGYAQPDSNGVYTFKMPATQWVGVRFSVTSITENTIITKNQPIE